MNQVRVLGDPVGASPASAVLRAFIRLAHDSGMRCALIALDGQPCAMPGDLAGCLVPAIAATAPILVFAPPPTAAAAASLARRRWPRACVVVVVRADARAEELLDRVRAELRWAGVEDPPHALAERELAPWLALGTLRANGPIVAVHDGDAESHVDAVFAAWKRHLAATGRRLRVIVTNSDPAVQASIAAAARGAAPPVEVVGGPFVPGCVEDASAVVLPWRRLRPTRNLVLALASGRPACVPALPSLAWLPVPRVAVPIEIDTGAGDGELAPAAVAAALDLALADGAAIGGNARTFVREELTRDRPAAPPLPRPDQSMVPAIDCVEAASRAAARGAGAGDGPHVNVPALAIADQAARMKRVHDLRHRRGAARAVGHDRRVGHDSRAGGCRIGCCAAAAAGAAGSRCGWLAAWRH